MLNNRVENYPKSLLKLYFHHYIVRFEAQEDTTFPSFQGAWLRGLFGQIAAEIYLEPGIAKSRNIKNKTSLRDILMLQLPESKPASKSRFTSESGNPRPYVFSPDIRQKKRLKKGELFSFGFTLVGKCNLHLNQVIDAFIKMGKHGFGNEQNTFNLLSVTETHSGNDTNTVFHHSKKRINKPELPILLKNFLDTQFKKEQATIQFETFTRLGENDCYHGSFSFHDLTRNIAARLQNLACLYCGAKPESLADFLQYAPQVKIQHTDLYWNQYATLQTENNNHRLIDGYTGLITFSGKFNRYLPLLKIGEFLHAGKDTAYGAGKYRLLHENFKPL